MAVGAHHGRDLAVTPGGPVAGVLRRQRFDRVDGRGRPRPLDRLVAGPHLGESPSVGAFRDAGQPGEPRDRQLLAADVVGYGHGGGNAPSWPRQIFGCDRVSRLFAGWGQLADLGIRLQLHEVNGQPGAVMLDPQ